MNLDIGSNMIPTVIQEIKENYSTSASWNTFAKDGEQSVVCLLQI